MHSFRNACQDNIRKRYKGLFYPSPGTAFVQGEERLFSPPWCSKDKTAGFPDISSAPGLKKNSNAQEQHNDFKQLETTA